MIIMELLTVLLAAGIFGWSAANHKVPRGILEWVVMIVGTVIVISWLM